MNHIRRFNESNSDDQEILNEYSERINEWLINYDGDIGSIVDILSDLNTILEDFKNEDIDLKEEHGVTLGNESQFYIISDYIKNPNMINDIIDKLDRLRS